MRQITPSDLMNPRVLVVRDTMTVRELAAFLMDNEITGAPVKNRNGELVGVVSVVDVTRAVAEEAADPCADRASPEEPEPAPGEDGEVLVADVMRSGLFSVSEDATVSEVASAMLDGHLHRLLVTRNGEPIGIITTSDLLGLLVDEED
ncbi:MAG: CBS domain-containing protein [bacterium]|nr:CBS domain-containing protein [bacterium]